MHDLAGVCLAQEDVFRGHDEEQREAAEGGEHGDVDEGERGKAHHDVGREEQRGEREREEVVTRRPREPPVVEDVQKREEEDREEHLPQHEGERVAEVVAREAGLVDEDGAQGGGREEEKHREDVEIALQGHRAVMRCRGGGRGGWRRPNWKDGDDAGVGAGALAFIGENEV